jgi:hypothetical protein
MNGKKDKKNIARFAKSKRCAILNFFMPYRHFKDNFD